jgi:putative chitinase
MNLWEKYKTLFNGYHINTDLRISHFMAQLEHESGGLKPKSENLYYSQKGLLQTFGKYFNHSPEEALKFQKKPKLIANRVYANRMGNGNEASGDGWKYRGRAFFQLTGKNNYLMLSKDTKIDCFNNPDILLEEANAIISALWYWSKNKLNDYADKDDLDAISDLINLGHHTQKEGDAIGYKHRKELLTKYKKILNEKS